jgi:hypothetical protein
MDAPPAIRFHVQVNEILYGGTSANSAVRYLRLHVERKKAAVYCESHVLEYEASSGQARLNIRVLLVHIVSGMIPSPP